MLSHNNWRARIKKYEPKKQRFTLKKLTIGVASVLLGFFFAGTSTASADDGNQQGTKPQDGTANENKNVATVDGNQAVLTTQSLDTNASAALATQANPAGDVKQDEAAKYENAVANAVNQSAVQQNAAATSTASQAPASSSAAANQDATQLVRYVNNANTNEVIGTQPFTGKTGDVVDIYNNLQAPANWQLVSGQRVQTTAVLQANANPIDVLVEHQKEIEYGFQHKDDTDLYRSITRTITYNFPTGAPQKFTQPVTYSRNKTTDKVTGQATYSDWEATTVDQNRNKLTSFGQMEVPTVPGYTASAAGAQIVTENGKQYIPAENVTPDTPSSAVVISYGAGEHQLVINYVDNNNHSNIVSTQNITGKTGEHVAINVKAPANWKLVSGQQVLSSLTFGSNDPAPVTVYVEHESSDATNDQSIADKLTKTVTYTINGDMNGQTFKIASATFQFHRTATKDSVTGEVTYGKWSNGVTAQAVNVAREGYVALATDQTSHQVDIVNGQIPATLITVDTPDTTITVSYGKNDTTHPTQQGHNDQNAERVVRFDVFENVNGTLLSTTTVKGKVGQTVPVNIQIPYGWALVPGEKLPTSYTFPDTATVDQQIYVGRDTTMNDLNRTVTRQILGSIKSENQQTQIGLQRVDFMRDGQKDSVTGQITYGDWKQEGSIDAFQIPQREGYTTQVDGKNVTELPAVSVNPDSKSSVVNVIYVPVNDQKPSTDQEQTIHVNFVEKATGNVIASVPLTGKVGQTVQLDDFLTKNIPTNWQFSILSGHQNAVTFEDPATADVNIAIEHGRKYLDNKTTLVGNKILAHYDDGRVVQIFGTTTNAPIRVYRDLVTGQVVEGDFAGQINIPPYVIPDQPGYTFEKVEGPDITDPQTRTIPGMTATRNTDGVRTYTVYYVGNKQSAKINYVDVNNHSNVVSTQTIDGTTGKTVDVTLQIPAGWEIVGNQSVPSTITFGTSPIADTTVYVRHQLKQEDNETKTVTQTIYSTNPVNGQTTKVREASISFSRPVQKDMATGELVKGDWSKASQSFGAYTAQTLPGYTTQIDGKNATEIPAETVTPDSASIEHTITYVANDQSTKINYVDANNHSNVVSTQVISGKTGEAVGVILEVPANWQIVGGQQVPSSFTFGSNPIADSTVYVEHKTTPVDPSDQGELSKTVTRTVHGQYPDGSYQIAHQDRVTFTRNGSTDLVTGKTTYGKWNEESHHFNQINIQQIPGYTSYIDGKKATSIPAEDVTPNSKSEDYTLTYRANDQSTKINYVDSKDHSHVVSTQTISGKTGQSVNITLDVPANWQIVGGQQVPTSVTFGSNPIADTTIYVEHKTDNTTNDSSEKSNTSRTVTRVVKANVNGNVQVLSTVTAQFSRTATKDLVTGETTYGKWTNNVNVPAVNVARDGYTATATDQNGNAVAISNGQIAGTTLTPDSKDQVITVNYAANSQETHIKYVNKETGKQVGMQTISGKTGDTVTVKLEVPANYQVVNGESVPSVITFGSTPVADTTVLVEPAKKPINPGQPGDPNHADTNRSVTRTIYATGAGYNHGILHQDMANFTRSGMYDPTTGLITYNPWNQETETFGQFEIPVREGYKAYVDGQEVTSIPALTVNPDSKNTTVEVTYKPVEHSMKINFINKDTNAVVSTQTVTGKTGDLVPVTLNVPKGWRMVGGQTVPTGIGFGKDGHADVNILVEHATKDVTNDSSQASQTHRVVKHTVNAVINGQTITRATVDAEFNRTATKDLATGDVTYGAWTKNVDFPAVEVARAGFTATATDQLGKNVAIVNGVIPATTITPDSQDEIITVNYTANTQETHIKYVNNDTKTVVSTQTISGKTGEAVNVTLQVPEGFEIVGGQQVPATITFGSTPVADTTVYIEAKKTPSKPDQPGNQPSNPSTKIDNLRTVKRTINATDPMNNHILLHEDMANFTRTASIDSVTGEVTYGSWNETSHQFGVYNIKQLAGYVTKVDGKVVTSIPAETVGIDSKDQTIEVTYVPVEQSVKINYINRDNQQVISTQTVNGKTGQSVSVTLEVPAGYQIVSGQSYPTSIGFGGQKQNDWNILVEPKSDNNNNNPADQNRSTNINFVNKANGETISTQTVSGKVGETVNVTLNVPAGYEIIAGEQVPSSFTFGTNPIPDSTVYVQVKKTPVNPGKPGDPNHADTNRTVTRTIYATGAGYNHGVLHQDMANFMRGGQYDPTNGVITYDPWNQASQTFAAYQINVPAGYKAYIDGQEVTSIPALTVNPDSKNTTVEVTFEPAEQSMKINYIDNGDHSHVVSTQTVSGKTGETVPVNLEVPAGWRVVGGQSVPTGIGFGSKAHADVTVYVEHDTQDVTSDPSQTSATHRVVNHVINEVINGQTITRASVKAEFNRIATKDLATGDVTYGAWTKNVDFPAVNVARAGFTAVATDQDGNNVALVNNQVPATVITPDSKDETITVNYTANDQSTTITYVDQTTGKQVGTQTISGKTGETVNVTLNVPAGYEVTGGQNVLSSVTFGGQPVPGSTVYVQPSQGQPTNPDQPGDKGDHGNHGDQPSNPTTLDNQKVVKRIINFTDPAGNHSLMHEDMANFTRTAYIDSVSGNVTYGPWNETSHEFSAYAIKQLPGFETQVNGKAVTTIPAETVGLDSKDEKIEVVYVPLNQIAKINYINKSDNKVISTQTITGKTGQSVRVSLEIPAGYQIVSGQSYPTSIGFGSKPQSDFNILVEPKSDNNGNQTDQNRSTKINFVNQATGETVGTQTISGKVGETVNVTLNVPAGYEVNSNQQVPSSFTFGTDPIADSTVYVHAKTTPVNPGKPGDPNHADTNRTVTRTIYATGAGYNHGILHQDMANFMRGGQYNPMTGEITYDPWNQASQTFAAYQINVPAGYKAYVDGKEATSIPALTVNPDSKNTTFEVTFEPAEQSMKINYIDNGDHSHVVSTQTVTGKTGETVPVDLNVPAGWRVVGGQSVPTGIGFGSQAHANVTVYVEHDTQDVTNDPSQTNATHRVVKHQVIENFNGQLTTRASVTAEFNRTATKDLNTNKVTYGSWTKNVDFPAVNVNHAGYTASATDQNGNKVELVNGQVPATTITPDSKDETITVNYTADDQSTTITYVDQTTGKQVGTQTITGKTGETVNVTLNVPAGYEVTGGQNVLSSVTFGGQPIPGSTVYVQPSQGQPTNPDQPGNKGDHGDHGDQPTTPTDPSKLDNQRIVKRIINFTDPTGKHGLMKEDVANFTRTAYIDSVSGKATYGPWNETSHEFAAYAIKQLPGYETQVNGKTVTTIPAETVGLDSKTETIEVVYVPVEQTAKINYINKSDNTVIATQTITGKTGETVNVTLNVPAGYQIVSGQSYPAQIGFGGQPQNDWNILVEPKETTPAQPGSSASSDNSSAAQPGSSASSDNSNAAQPGSSASSDNSSAAQPGSSASSDSSSAAQPGSSASSDNSGSAKPVVPHGENNDSSQPSDSAATGSDSAEKSDNPAESGAADQGTNTPNTNNNAESGEADNGAVEDPQDVPAPVVPHADGSETQNISNSTNDAQQIVDSSLTSEGFTSANENISNRSQATNGKHRLPQTGNEETEGLALASLGLAGLTGVLGATGLKKKRQ